MTIVLGHGPRDASWMIVGEAPGFVEAMRTGRPFTGPSGVEQETCLRYARDAATGREFSLSSRSAYMTNVVPLYREGNPDPTPEDVAEWSPLLESDIASIQPRVILAVGRFAARWFLGDTASLDVVHGRAYRAGFFDASRRSRGGPADAIIVPCHHPAFGLRLPAGRVLVHWDYSRAAEVVHRALYGLPVETATPDPWHGREHFTDVSGAELAAFLAADSRRDIPRIVALDTEGRPDVPWSMQISTEPGHSHVLRWARRFEDEADYRRGTAALQALVDAGWMVVTHDAGTPMGACYDTMMCRVLGVELRDARHWNTMSAAFHLRVEPRGLKALTTRWLSGIRDDYESLLAGLSNEAQVAYLRRVAAMPWPKPEPRPVLEPDGRIKISKPQGVGQLVKGILRDIDSGKTNKDGETTDPAERWSRIDKHLRRHVEEVIGSRMPEATLDDVDFDRALYYAALDSSDTYRLVEPLAAEIDRMGLSGVLATHHEILPVIEEMQREGMPASRRAFVDLAGAVTTEMDAIRSQLSWEYNGGRPFNPGPGTKDVDKLLGGLGIVGLKTSRKSGKLSQSKKHLEQYRHAHPALGLVFDYRERQKILSTYCLPLIEIADQQFEISVRRLGELEKKAKTCVVCRPGEPCIMHTERPEEVESAPDRFMGDDPWDDDVPGATYTLKGGHVYSGNLADTRESLPRSPVDSAGASSSDLFVVRTKLKPVTTESRRLSAEDPSLLNQPSRTKLGQKVRACYMTGYDDDCEEVFGAWDFAAQEVRVAAHVAAITAPAVGGLLVKLLHMTPTKDEPWIGDPHYETAARVFGKPIHEIDKKKERDPAKTAFFGMLYGLQETGLLDLFRSFGLDGWTMDGCERLIRAIKRDVYPELGETIDRVTADVKRTGMVRDLFGFIRYLPAIRSLRIQESSEAARQGFSHIVQATAQGLTQNAMASIKPKIRELQRGGMPVSWALQIHDELVVRHPRWAWPVIDPIMRYGMTERCGIRLKVPVLADGHMHHRWDRLK